MFFFAVIDQTIVTGQIRSDTIWVVTLDTVTIIFIWVAELFKKKSNCDKHKHCNYVWGTYVPLELHKQHSTILDIHWPLETKVKPDGREER